MRRAVNCETSVCLQETTAAPQADLLREDEWKELSDICLEIHRQVRVKNETGSRADVEIMTVAALCSGRLSSSTASSLYSRENRRERSFSVVRVL